MKTQKTTLYTKDKPLRLESGKKLTHVEAAYQTYGTLNADGTNAILVCHALTGNAHAAGALLSDDISYNDNHTGDVKNNNIPPKTMYGWWDGIIGAGKAIDTSKYYVICANFLGSCYGTTGPTSMNPDTNERYGLDFPQITVRDMVKVQYTLLRQLGVNQLVTVTGGSLGGMQALEWALLYPDFVQSIIPIAASARHSAWAIGLNEAARNAIKADPEWQGGKYNTQPHKGLALARMIAMISYRSPVSFEQKFNRKKMIRNNGDIQSIFGEKETLFEVESYLRYQGEKLANRFDANTYLCISEAMDSHDVTRDRGTLQDVLGSITFPVLSVGINSDVLYPLNEQLEIASTSPNARYGEIDSIHGHDAFLIEFDQLQKLIPSFINEVKIK